MPLKTGFRLPKASHLLFVTLFVATTIAFQSTAGIHNTLLWNGRSAALAASLLLVGVICILGLARRTMNRDLFMVIVVYTGLLLTGISLSFIWGGSIYLTENRNRVIFLAVSFGYCVTLFNLFRGMREGEEDFSGVLNMLALYFFFSILLLFAVGGLRLSVPPSVEFTESDGSPRYYSLGFTKFYAMASVFFFVFASSAKRFRLACYGLAVLSLGFSVLGGARGDLVAAVVVIALFVFRRPTLRNLSYLGAGTFVVVVYIFQSGLWRDLLVFRRLLSLSESGVGRREELAAYAIQVIGEEAGCWLTGCGFNYFQAYFNYEWGLYPHNIMLEAPITFGLIVGGGLVILSLIGLYKGYRGWGRENPLFYLMLLDFATLQKSGSLAGFTGLALLVTFSALALTSARTQTRPTVATPALAGG